MPCKASFRIELRMFGITTHTMKKFAGVSALLALLIIMGLLLWPRLHSANHSPSGYTTSIELSGTPDASFTGEYLREGKRVAFSGVLPWSMTESNLSRLEIRKAKREDTLLLNARGGGSMVSANAAPGTTGLRVKLEGGWNVETLR
jgi:hypothetical protein